jgi:hypothetical protein
MSTITITVAFVILLYSILDILPLVLLKQVQNSVGEADFVFTAVAPKNISQSIDTFMYSPNYIIPRAKKDSTVLPLLNYTLFSAQTSKSSLFDGFSPRWYSVCSFENPKKQSVDVSGVLILIDTKQEANIGLGRGFSKRVLGEGQGMMTKSALKYLEIKPDGSDPIQLIVDVREQLAEIYGTSKNLTTEDVEKLMEEFGIEANSDGIVEIEVGDIINFDDLSGIFNSLRSYFWKIFSNIQKII